MARLLLALTLSSLEDLTAVVSILNLTVCIPKSRNKFVCFPHFQSISIRREPFAHDIRLGATWLQCMLVDATFQLLSLTGSFTQWGVGRSGRGWKK